MVAADDKKEAYHGLDSVGFGGFSFFERAASTVTRHSNVAVNVRVCASSGVEWLTSSQPIPATAHCHCHNYVLL
jgi:hypothetical protein